MRGDRAGRDRDLTAHDLVTADAPEQQPDVPARDRLGHVTVERLDAFHDRLPRLAAATDDLDAGADREPAALDLAGDHGAEPLDAAHALDGHEEGGVVVPLGHGHVGVEGLDEGEDLLHPRVVPAPLLTGAQRLEGRAPHEGRVDVVVRLEQLGHLDLDEVEQLGVGDVHLVDEHHDVLDADLPREQDVLTRLRLHPDGSVHEQDRAVHLGRARDHVLDEVGMPGAVDVRVHASPRLVLHVRGLDRDAPPPLLGRVVDVAEAARRPAERVGRGGRQRRRQRRLAVVHVADRADAQVLLLDVHLSTFSVSPHAPRPSRTTEGDLAPPGDAGRDAQNCEGPSRRVPEGPFSSSERSRSGLSTSGRTCTDPLRERARCVTLSVSRAA